jgi:hypothetical protein
MESGKIRVKVGFLNIINFQITERVTEYCIMDMTIFFLMQQTLRIKRTHPDVQDSRLPCTQNRMGKNSLSLRQQDQKGGSRLIPAWNETRF